MNEDKMGTLPDTDTVWDPRELCLSVRLPIEDHGSLVSGYKNSAVWQ